MLIGLLWSLISSKVADSMVQHSIPSIAKSQYPRDRLSSALWEQSKNLRTQSSISCWRDEEICLKKGPCLDHNLWVFMCVNVVLNNETTCLITVPFTWQWFTGRWSPWEACSVWPPHCQKTLLSTHTTLYNRWVGMYYIFDWIRQELGALESIFRASDMPCILRCKTFKTWDKFR